ncbi:hypothetical protein SCHPADRAFT_999981 [Schizopora paradoxa]|uniref:Uncharacterized protein n=1 Tax=Schizopora paradoxa TaxID=27342 RepID=A0A0H2RE62_9AGAM|nr:hypothetical protein SCHPADRAFT_999981 [Schizopora paradoxa]
MELSCGSEDRKFGTFGDRVLAYLVEPIDILPHFLLPASTAHLNRRPPTFHLGWLIEDAVVTKLAKDRGFCPRNINLREYLKDEDVEIFDEDLDDSPKEPGFINKTQGFVRRCRELQLDVIPGLRRVYNSSKRDISLAVSLMSNYEVGIGRYNREDREKLVDEFRFIGEPKWYLDYDEWHWI